MNELITEFNEEFERENPDVLYNGAIAADEDPADYYGFSVKAVRLG